MLSRGFSCDERGALKPVQLHVIHDHGGGIARWCRDFCLADAAGANLVLAPYSASHAMSEGLVLYAGAAGMTPLAFWPFTTPIQAVVETHPEYRRAIEEIVRDYGVGFVLVSSLIGHALDVLDTGLPTLVINHDYFPACPTINLHFGQVCGQCDDARLADCAAHNPNFNPFPAFPIAERLRVRARYLELVTRGATVMVVPDDHVRVQLLQVFPRLEAASFVTIPHGCLDVFAPIDYAADEPRDRLRVVVLGVLPLHKGARLLSEGLQRLLEFAEIHLVGAKEFGETFHDMAGVHIVDQYAIEELPAILASIQPDVGLLPSIVPETFSYTLSELFQLGIPPVATRLGAFASRILPGETGYIFEPNVEAMLECLRDIHANRDGLRRIRARLPSLPVRTAAQMVAEYRQLLPSATNAGGHAHASPQSARDPVLQLAMTQTLALSRQWKEISSLRLRLDLKAERFRAVNHRSAGLQTALLECEDTIWRLEQEVHEKNSAITARDAQLAAVYASTSWAVSRPVRWAGKALRRARRLMSLLGRPAALPAVAAGVYRGWRQGRAEEVKPAPMQALTQSPVSASGSGAAAVPATGFARPCGGVGVGRLASRGIPALPRVYYPGHIRRDPSAHPGDLCPALDFRAGADLQHPGAHAPGNARFDPAPVVSALGTVHRR